MPSGKKSIIAPESGTAEQGIKKLGIIAGGGQLPKRLLEACEKQGIEVFIVGFNGHTDPAILESHRHMLTRMGAAGQIINTLKAHGIHDLVMIGSINRPTLSDLRPDAKTATFFAKLGFKALGDDGLLKAVKAELEKDGFTLHGVHEFVAELLAGQGLFGKRKPAKTDKLDISHGVKILKATGKLDIGQGIIVQQGIVLGLEAVEGTDELIRRCGPYHRKGKGGVLVKLSKEGQDETFDLPTIGPDTIRNAAAAGLTGIAIEAGKALVAGLEETIALADKEHLFIIGINPAEF